MSRFLFVVPPLTGHVNPTVSVGAALAARGHEVAWVGHPGKVRPLLPPDATLLALPEAGAADQVADLTARANKSRGLASLKLLWEDFLLPLAHAMVPGVEAAVAAWAPDALIVDQQALAGAIVARRMGLPWATTATTSASVVEPLADFPQVLAWRDAQHAALQAAHGLPPVAEPDRSPHLVLVFSTADLVGPLDRFPPHYAFVGPAFSRRPSDAPFPWDALAPGRRVLVSLGTVNAERGAAFYRAVTEGMASAPWQVILVAPADRVGDLPENVLRCDYVPQVALLPHVDAVVCHGGHNTVCEALAHGRPLVVAPIKDDQPVVAAQVVAAGAGVRVRFGRVTGADLASAVREVLDDPRYAAAARRVAAGFTRAGGAEAAARHLEGMLDRARDAARR